ncbi:hypothetical protein FE257_004939, partial [Aspergillus nanangensis]
MALSEILGALWVWKWHILGVFGVYWALWVVYAHTLHPYARYPGPFLASFSRSWVVMEVVRGRAHKTQAALHKKHGPIVRICPNEVVISDPACL